MSAHPESCSFTVFVCSECPHAHIIFYDDEDNVLCEAVLSADQLRRAADACSASPPLDS